MRRVIIFGYFGSGNLGDETSLGQLVSFLKGVRPNWVITIISANPRETAERYETEAVGKFNWVGIMNKIRQSDLLLGGGGSLFQDRTSLRSLLYYAMLVLLARFFAVRVFLYGQGIGPIRSRFGKWVAQKALSAVDVITARDRLSIIALAELGVRKPNLYFTAEPLLLMAPVLQQEVESFWEQYPATKQFRIGLVIQEMGFLNRKFWRQWLELLSWSYGTETYLIPLHRDDYLVLQKLANRYEVTLLPLQTNWAEFQRVVGGLDLVISTRLHGLVAAVVQSVPCFGLATDPKIEGFCLQLGVPFTLVSSETDVVTLCNRIMKQLEEPPDARKPWVGQLNFWKVRAMENQAVLKNFVGKIG